MKPVCHPLFSVIVVALNAEATIKKTIRSVLDQSFSDFEVIVKDGLSTDRTLAEIPDDARIAVYSQKDASVYDAMNQAVRFARGRYVIFMNCGDIFYSDAVLQSVADQIEKKGLIDDTILYGNYASRGTVYRQSPVIDRKRIVSAGLCHQSVFCGRVLFERFGGFDTAMQICADHEHMARLFVKGIPFVYMEETVCDYQGDGLSERAENLRLVRSEGNHIRRRYFTKRDRMRYQFDRLKKRIFRK